MRGLRGTVTTIIEQELLATIESLADSAVASGTAVESVMRAAHSGCESGVQRRFHGDTEPRPTDDDVPEHCESERAFRAPTVVHTWGCRHGTISAEYATGADPVAPRFACGCVPVPAANMVGEPEERE